MEDLVIYDYKIVSAKSAELLEKEVVKMLEKDFEPIGGVAISSEGVFYQAMVQYDEEEPDAKK